MITHTSQRLVIAQLQPVLTATPDYSAGDAMGTGGALAIAGATIHPGGVSRVRSVNATFAGTTATPGITLIFFNANPAASTLTDNGALAIHADDDAKLIGHLALGTFVATGGVSSVVAQTDIPFRLPADSTTLYVVAMASGTINVDAATDLIIRVAIEQVA